MKIYRILICIIIFIFAVSFAGCGGGGSGGSGSSSGGTGSVAVVLTDGPADEYDHIWIRVKEVTLIPSQGDKVVIYKSYEGYKLDLLAYRDEDFLLTMKKRVPAGTYEKIRLEISDIVPEPKSGTGACSDMKLPSGKIDLNPRGTFEVEPKETLAIRLDIDANKSINISGSCNFRPVVFVDIEPIAWQRCPKVLKGVIEDLIDENEDGAIEGFVLDLQGSRGTLDVCLSEDTEIFDENGLPVGSYDFVKEETVWVRGRLDVDGNLQASEVVIGSVDSLKGTVETAYDEQDKTFSLKTEEDESYTVHLSGETLVLVGCDEEVDPSSIQPEMLARVFGKLSDDNKIQAIMVFLKPEEISGEIVSLEPSNDGHNLTIKVSGDEEVTVFVPKDTVYLEGDGKIEDKEMNLLCEGRQVRVVLDPDKELTAEKVIVEADSLEGWVYNIDEIDASSLVVSDGETYVDVQVREGATISDLREEIKPAGINDIKKDDDVRCFGLYACPPDEGFYGFIIFIVDEP